jgi:hypothetical protein
MLCCSPRGYLEIVCLPSEMWHSDKYEPGLAVLLANPPPEVGIEWLSELYLVSTVLRAVSTGVWSLLLNLYLHRSRFDMAFA